MNRDMREMSQMMDLTGKWPYPNILEYHTIQGQHEIHYHKTMAPTTILAWECGCCKKMNKDIMFLCFICFMDYCSLSRG